MKVHLIKRQSIEDYAVNNAKSRTAFAYWLSVLKFADWEIPEDIMSTFGSADLLGDGVNRVIFNISGNDYRMICKYAFGKKEVHLFICWIGTHAEYTKLSDKNKQYEINVY